MTTTKKSLTRIEKRKRLETLFDRGSYVRFNADDEARPVVNPSEENESDVLIWVCPPSPLQREMAVREAQAGRALVMIDARDKDGSPQWLTVRGFVHGLKVDSLIDYVLDLDETEHLSQARRDVLVQKEWDDFNALRDAMRQYDEADNKDADEWKPLVARDLLFGEQVEKRLGEVREDARDGYRLMPRGKIEEKAIDKRIEQAGSAAFMGLYEEWMLFYSLRDDEDHQELYFEKVDEVKSLPAEVQVALAEKLATYISDLGEAKN